MCPAHFNNKKCSTLLFQELIPTSLINLLCLSRERSSKKIRKEEPKLRNLPEMAFLLFTYRQPSSAVAAARVFSLPSSVSPISDPSQFFILCLDRAPILLLQKQQKSVCRSITVAHPVQSVLFVSELERSTVLLPPTTNSNRRVVS
jgi:hypothetical protein